MAGTDQWPMYFLVPGGERAPTGQHGVVLVVTCPDCKALTAAPDLDDHRTVAHG